MPIYIYIVVNQRPVCSVSLEENLRQTFVPSLFSLNRRSISSILNSALPHSLTGSSSEMSHRKDQVPKSLRGTNPQNVVEKILLSNIYQNKYWQEHCLGLTAETLVCKAMELDHLGGTFGGNREPTPFMCLVMKMLQIQPEKDIVVKFIKNNHRYVRILGAFYMRLTGTDTDIYNYLEQLYNDYRKLKLKLPDGQLSLTHVDEVIDELLTQDYSCNIALPRIKKRWDLEKVGALEPKISFLEDDFEEDIEEEEKEKNNQLDDGLEDRADDFEEEEEEEENNELDEGLEDRAYEKGENNQLDHGLEDGAYEKGCTKMANCMDPTAKSIGGMTPQSLLEKAVRSKIYQSTYWKEQCLGLTEVTLVDKAVELDHIGSTFGSNCEPTPFMCLVMKMLQMQPEQNIVVEFIENDFFRYARVLGAFYLRLTGTDIDVYRHLEPLYNDYRKLKQKLPDGQISLTQVDEVIDELLTKDYSCGIVLPGIRKRWDLEAIGALQPRESVSEDSVEEEEEENNQHNDGVEDGAYEEDCNHGRSLQGKEIELQDVTDTDKCIRNSESQNHRSEKNQQGRQNKEENKESEERRKKRDGKRKEKDRDE